jgi:hypothetical protein
MTETEKAIRTDNGLDNVAGEGSGMHSRAAIAWLLVVSRMTVSCRPLKWQLADRLRTERSTLSTGMMMIVLPLVE